MLYISRRIGVNKWCVVDTEDGTEEAVSINELEEAVCKMGIEIKGVDTTVPPGRKARGLRVYRVNVYQNVDCMRASQMKMNIINGVDIKTNGTEVTSVSWQKLNGRKPVSVRLSDYGASCADYLFSDIREYAYGAESFLTLILDDKIKVRNKSFKRCGTFGILFDLRELSDDRMAECVYKEFLAERYVSVTMLKRRVMDRPDRHDYWKAMCVLNCGFASSEPETHIRQVVADPVEVCRKIDKKFAPEFLSLSNCQFGFSARGTTSGSPQQYFQWVLKPSNRQILTCDDFDYMKLHCMSPLFRVLQYDSTCNSNAIVRLKNYVNHFDAIPEVRCAFVVFCQRANKFIVDCGMREGWSQDAVHK